ncbi:PaaI family thioesterase [Nocardioides sp.]|uniref:PaaI family thioesterase n=1 Tax=Nocardioides sp. TaxID=35761 RepID=UPI002B26DB6E|nr:PaaI family thioesterase [Nocardioides sp.]
MNTPDGAFELPMTMDPFSTYLGLELTEVTGSRVVATWAAKPQLHQPYGIVHGGAHCSVVETLGSIGSAVWLGDKGQCVGVNNHTDFFRAISEGALTSVATPLHQGRSQQLWVVETTADETGKVIARGQLRVQNLYPRS